MPLPQFDYFLIPSAGIPTGGYQFSLRRAFYAASIIVDNYTPNWLYLQTLNSYVPPYTLGWTANYNSSASSENIASRNPSGVPVVSVSGFPDGGVRVLLSTELYLPSLGNPYAASPYSAPVVTVAPPIIYGGNSSGFEVAFLSTVVTIGVTATPLPTTIFTNRRAMVIQSILSNTARIYIGGSGVTASESSTGGIQIDPGQNMPIDAAAAIPYAICAIANQKLVVLEGA